MNLTRREAFGVAAAAAVAFGRTPPPALPQASMACCSAGRALSSLRPVAP